MSALPALVGPALEKSKGLAEELIDKAKDKIVEVGFDSDLNVVKAGSGESVFDLRLTPALVGILGVLGLAAFIFVNWRASGVGSSGWTVLEEFSKRWHA